VISATRRARGARAVALLTSAAGLLLALIGAFQFDPAAGRVTVADTSWVPQLGLRYHLAVDGISITLLVLTGLAAVVGVLFVLPLILLPLGTSIQNSVGQFMPMLIAENSLTAVKPVAHSLSAGVGFAVLCGYAAAALAAGAWALARRDA